MKKITVLIFLVIAANLSAHAQVEAIRNLGKNAPNQPCGFGLFAFYHFPLNQIGNRSLALELLDFVYLPAKGADDGTANGYVSIKAGYRYIFSEENATGFYAEPQLGYCRVVNAKEGSSPATFGDGVAVAMEGGYTLEVGENLNNLNFGLKYEADLAGKNHTMHTLAFRVSYSFHLFSKRKDY